VTADETSFHLLDADCEAAVEIAAERAGIQLIRVLPAEEHVARRADATTSPT
jgi:hypothetical protein